MKKAWLALVFGSALFLAACGGGDEATNTNDNADNTEETTTNNQGATDDTDTGTSNENALAEGEAVVQQACINCHGQNLEGMGNFPALNNVGANLSEEQILNVINNGQGGMPGGIVKGEAAEAAAAYLATLK